ncbi:hypothetical protein [Qipengyuania sp. ASV99]|uniref:hypothetical protein n=1 Tax=Qipengyuania sp. ASV99 TaxID=3399681 RepID=UPI003A4C59C6
MRGVIVLAGLALLSTSLDTSLSKMKEFSESEASDVRAELDYQIEDLRSEIRDNEREIEDLELRILYRY